LNLRQAALSLQRSAPRIAAAGAWLVLLQNLLFLAGIALLLSGARGTLSGTPGQAGLASSGARLASFSLYLDFAGLAMVGVGLLLIALNLRDADDRTDRRRLSAPRLAALSGAACLLWLALAVTWRLVLFPDMGRAAEDISSRAPGSEQSLAAIALFFSRLEVAMYVWMLASLALLFAALLFLLFLRRHAGSPRGSVAWTFFAALNAVATLFLAGAVLMVMHGGVEFQLLVTALFVKLGLVPLFGIPAYAFLGARFLEIEREEASHGEEE
jgi:hypothetical protein